jgi:hypothetical protein
LIRHCEGENWLLAPHAAHQFERAAAMPTHRNAATKQSSDFALALGNWRDQHKSTEALDCFATLAMTTWFEVSRRRKPL